MRNSSSTSSPLPSRPSSPRDQLPSLVRKMSTGGHSRSNSAERVPAEVGRDLVGLRMQILDNVKVWYGLKHPAKKFEFSLVTCSYRPNPGFPVLYSAMIVAFVEDNGVKEIHSKHDVRTRDAYREDQSKTRMEAMETLLADLEWRVNQCSNTYDTKLKRAPRADRKAWQ